MTRSAALALLILVAIASVNDASAQRSRNRRGEAARTISVREATPQPRYPESPVLHPEAVQPRERVGKPIVGTVNARVLEAPLDVPGAAATQGDFLLQNELITVVIGRPSIAHGNAVSGGYVIDGFNNDAPIDSLAQLHLFLNDKYPRMARFRDGRVSEVMSDSASVVMVGVDSENPAIDVTTTYTLRKGSRALELCTSISPREKAIQNYAIGDAFAWGSAQQFLPGNGFRAASGRVNLPWVGGATNSVAYALFASADNLWGPASSTWIDVSGTTASVEAGQSAEYLRYLVVAHDLAEAVGVLNQVKKTAVTEVRGTVTEAEGGYPADGIRVVIEQEGRVVAVAVSRGGKFQAALPAGKYSFTVSDRVRSAIGEPLAIQLPEEAERSVKLQVSSPAVAHFVVRDDNTGEVLPCKATFEGIDGTSTPDLGPGHERKARNIVDMAMGDERVAVPAGKYRIYISRGIEYDLVTHDVELNRNRETLIETRLKHVAKAPGYVAADFHQHMKNSFDSAIPLEDRVISGVAEGLQLIVASDHNFITDLSPVIRELNLQEWIASIIGDEVTTREFFFGHINAFPLSPDPARSGNGAVRFEKVTAAEIFEEAMSHPGEQVVQVNHPRSGDVGYFNRVSMSTEDGLTTHPNWCDRFTALEVFNGKRVDEMEEALVDWFNLLNMGYAFTATGNSDSHRILDQEPGYPRNYVRVAAKSASDIKSEDLVKAVNEQHAVFVTNGPLLEFSTRQGTPIGGLETVTSAPVEFKVSVRGANFVQPDRLLFYGNGKLLAEKKIPETAEPLKWTGTLSDTPQRDTWYMIKVLGSKTLSPVLNTYMVNGKQMEPQPAALTNPIWIDADGDGKFIAPNKEKQTLMQQDRRAEAKAKMDEMISEDQQQRRVRKAAPVTSGTTTKTGE